MRLWIDGKRKPPATYDTWAKTSWEAIEFIKNNKVSMVSMDYDLGNKSDTGDGYIVACWIEKQAVEKKLQRIQWNCHSFNIVGRKMIESVLKNAEAAWNNLL